MIQRQLTNVQQEVVGRLQRFNRARMSFDRMKVQPNSDARELAKLKDQIERNFHGINKTVAALMNTRLITPAQLDTCYIVAAQQI